jgi:hypothetical protein
VKLIARLLWPQQLQNENAAYPQDLEVEAKNAGLAFVYYFRVCVLRSKATEEYLSSPTGFL